MLYHDFHQLRERGFARIPAQQCLRLSWISQQLFHFGRTEIFRIDLDEHFSALRIDTFLVKHPYLKREEVPADIVTASASGLDPDISVASAYVQVKRVAEARGMSEEAVKAIVEKVKQGPLLGMFGPSKVNVLKLNMALDEKAD